MRIGGSITKEKIARLKKFAEKSESKYLKKSNPKNINNEYVERKIYTFLEVVLGYSIWKNLIKLIEY